MYTRATNSSQFETSSGIKIGMTIKEAKERGEVIELYSDLAGLNLILKKSNIIFKILKKCENLYFENGGEFPETLDENSIISEFKIK
jgi:hypothetical protein